MANSTTLYKLADGRTAVDVTEDKTLAITDQGVVQNVITDGINITLPATVVAYQFRIRNGGHAPTGAPAGAVSSKSVAVKVTPGTSNLIAGAGLSAANDKYILNTKSTSKVGDEVVLAGNGTTGWNIAALKGIWARQT